MEIIRGRLHLRTSRWLMVFSVPLFGCLIVPLCIGLTAVSTCQGRDDGLARTPPMGWNSWNTFRTNVNERLIHEIVDALVTTGMRDAGYQYVCIDDGWQQSGRDENHDLIADSTKFPSGMKALGDYIHSRGLKFGIYTSAGVKTCMSLEGSYGYEAQDAKLFAAWGVDFVKVDWCCTNPKYLRKRDCKRGEGQDYATTGQKELYARWRDAVSRSGGPMVLSICEWGTGKPWLWGQGVGHMWRTTEDIIDCWDCRTSWGGMGWTGILDAQVGLEAYAGPGHWNDPDMLVVGIKGLKDEEARAHFSLWCLLAAPLIAGNDIRNMTEQTLRTLTNPEVVAIDQDPRGVQGRRIKKNGDLEIWAKPLAHDEWAVALLNRSQKEAKIRVQWVELGLVPTPLRVRDLWARTDRGFHRDGYEARVGSRAVALVKLSK